MGISTLTETEGRLKLYSTGANRQKDGTYRLTVGSFVGKAIVRTADQLDPAIDILDTVTFIFKIQQCWVIWIKSKEIGSGRSK